jgi:hypothetical protein
VPGTGPEAILSFRPRPELAAGALPAQSGTGTGTVPAHALVSPMQANGPATAGPSSGGPGYRGPRYQGYPPRYQAGPARPAGMPGDVSRDNGAAASDEQYGAGAFTARHAAGAEMNGRPVQVGRIPSDRVGSDRVDSDSVSWPFEQHAADTAV